MYCAILKLKKLINIRFTHRQADMNNSKKPLYRFSYIFAIALACISPANLLAAEEDLAAQFVNEIFAHLENQTAQGNLMLSEPVSTSRRNGVRILHIPQLTVFENGINFADVGEMTITVSQRSDKEVKFDINLPDTIQISEIKDYQIIDITLNDGTVSGAWRDDLQIFTAYSLEFSNFAATMANDDGKQEYVNLDSMKLGVSFDESGSGLWKLRFSVEANNIDTVDEQFRLLIGKFLFDVYLGEVDFVALSKLLATVPEMEAVPDSYVHFVDVTLAEDLQEFTSNFVVNNFILDSENPDQVSFSLGEWTLQTDIKNTDGFYDLSLEFGLKEFASEFELNSVTQQLIPEEVTVEFEFKNIPYQLVVYNWGEGSDGVKRGDAFFNFLKVYSARIEESKNAGSGFNLTGINVVAPVYSVNVSGGFEVDSQTELGVAGFLTARIKGLDDIMRILSENGNEIKNSKFINRALSVVRGFGNPEVPEEGESITYRYDFEIYPSGLIALNDLPLRQASDENGESEDLPVSDTDDNSDVTVYEPVSARGKKLAELLGNQFSPHRADQNNWTHLHYAAILDLPKLAQALIHDGANVNASLKDDGMWFHQDLGRNLIEFGLDFRGAPNWKQRHAQTPLHFAVYANAYHAVEILVTNGADVNARGSNGDTPLHIAGKYNRRKIAKFLISFDEIVTGTENKAGRTALDESVENEADDVAELLRDLF